MVFEFPELQGTMGGIYAREEGQPEPVWKAIYYHYLPIGVEADAPPTRAQLGAAAVTWAAVSLADKLDTLVSLSRAGEKRDRLARSVRPAPRRRRASVRILMDLPELTGIDREVWLGPSLARAAAHAPDATRPWTDEAAQAALAFALERVRFVLEQRGVRRRGRPRAPRPRGDVSPLRARRVAEALQGMRGVGGLSGAGDAVQAREEHRAGSCRDGAARSIATRSPSRPSGAARRARRAAAARSRPRRRSSDYRAAFAEIAGLRRRSTGSSPRCS